MSAWIVTKTHIDALVQAMVVERVIEADKATEVGKHLWSENYRSVNARYGGRARRPAYRFEGIEAPLDDAVIARNIGCYWYQTCEHDGNECYDNATGTPLRALLTLLEARNGGEDFDNRIEKERGARLPWGINKWDDVVAGAQVSA
jgi:hypothetical protein